VSDKIKHVTDGSFDQDVLNAPGPVLVDYWAEWCGPCKMIAPIIEEIANEYGDRLTVAKMDTLDQMVVRVMSG
jgi:thioredoxin 1